MKINKNSWHYKLLNNTLYGGYKCMPSTICSYFWSLVFVLMIFFAATMLCVALVWFLFVPLHWIYHDFPKLDSYSKAFVEFGLLFYFAILSTLVYKTGCFVHLELTKRANSKPKIDKQPGIMTQFLRDKKDKVCTTIKYED